MIPKRKRFIRINCIFFFDINMLPFLYIYIHDRIHIIYAYLVHFVHAPRSNVNHSAKKSTGRH